MPKQVMKTMLFLGIVALAAAAGLAGLRVGSVALTMAILVLGLAALYGTATCVKLDEMVSATGAAFGALICGIFAILALQSGAIKIGLFSMGLSVVAALWLAYMTNNAVERWHDNTAK